MLLVELIVMGLAMYLNPRARRRAQLEESEGEKALNIKSEGIEGAEGGPSGREDGFGR